MSEKFSILSDNTPVLLLEQATSITLLQCSAGNISITDACFTHLKLTLDDQQYPSIDNGAHLNYFEASFNYASIKSFSPNY